MAELDRHDLETALCGRFRVFHALGRGGFGVVYEAEPVSQPGTRVALKVLPRPPGTGSQFEERFLREVRNAQRVVHPHVVRIFEYGAIPDGRLYYSMELCRGETLRQILVDGPVQIERAVRLCGEVLSALDAAHAIDMVHRDIKAENVTVVRDAGGKERAKVLDFGLAKVMSHSSSQELTKDGESLVTLAYAAPEQILGTVQIDGRADLYATGVLLYELIAGERPFCGRSDRALIEAHLLNPPPSLVAATAGRVSLELEVAVFRALAKNREQRYPDAASMARALEQAIGGGANRPASPAGGTPIGLSANPTEMSELPTVRLPGRGAVPLPPRPPGHCG